MAGKVKKPVEHNGRLLDGKDRKGNRYHVTYEPSYSNGHGGYILRKNSTEKVQCFSSYKNKEQALAEASSLFEKYVGEVAPGSAPIPQHLIQLEKCIEHRIIWIHLFSNGKDVIDTLSKFYDESNPLIAEDGEEPLTIEDLRVWDNKWDLQAVYNWWAISDAKEMATANKDFEPILNSSMAPGNFFNACHWNDTIFAVFNWDKNKPLILSRICNFYNMLGDFIKTKTKEELKEELFSAGIIIKGDDEWVALKQKEFESYWTNDRKEAHIKAMKEKHNLTVSFGKSTYNTITEEEFNQYYDYAVFKQDGNKITGSRNTIDKFYILDEALKLLKENPAAFSNYAKIRGIPNILKEP